MGRMNFLIALEIPILKIPLGILKNADFYRGLMPVFLAGIYKNTMGLKHCTRYQQDSGKLRHP